MAVNHTVIEVKIDADLKKIHEESENRSSETIYKLIDFLDSGREIAELDFKIAMQLIEKVDCKFVRFYLTKHKLTHEQQEVLINVVSKKEGLDWLVLDSFNFTQTMIQNLSNSPCLKELRIFNLEQCKADTLDFGMLSQIATLETLTIRYQSFASSKIIGGRNRVEQEQPTLNYNKSLITMKSVLTLINKSNLEAIEIPDAGIKQEDVAVLEQALEKNSNFKYICLPNSININLEKITGYVERNQKLQFPDDKIRIKIKKNGQKTMYYSGELYKKIGMIFKQKSGNDLKQSLGLLGFDPNGYCYTGDRNPILNSLIANEVHFTATRLIEEYSDELDLDNRDDDEKTALIIAAKTYSADSELEAILKVKGLYLDAQDEDGCTALHYLCAYGKIDFVKILLKKGANLLIKDNEGRLPIDYATILSAEDLRNIMMLMSFQADRDANAKRDNLFEYLGFGIKGTDIFHTLESSLANLENLERLIIFIQSPEFLKYNTQDDRKHFLERCLEARRVFSGKSIIETCLEQRKRLAKEISDPNFLLQYILFDANSSLNDVTLAALDMQLYDKCPSAIFVKAWESFKIWDPDYKSVLQQLESLIENLDPHVNIITQKDGLFDLCRESIKNNSRQTRMNLLTLTWVATLLHYISTSKVTFDPIQKKCFFDTLQDIVDIEDHELHFALLKIFGKALLADFKNLVTFLEKLHKQRYLAISLSLYSYSGEQAKKEFDEVKEAAEITKIRTVLSHKLYRQGVHNRTALQALVALLGTDITPKFRFQLIEQCYLSLTNQNDKSMHLKTWQMLRTIALCNLNKSIERYLMTNKSFSFQELYWTLFSEIFKLPVAAQSIYLDRFNHPDHHLLLGYRQNLYNECKPIFEEFIKSVFTAGNHGYRTLRYENSENPHLNFIFKGELGSYLQSVWSGHPIQETVIDGNYNGYSVHNTDDYWSMLTWGTGINCLEPLDGKIYLIYHLLDGQNRLLVLLDPKNQVIAGCILHLLLRNEQNPTPVLVISPIYIQDKYLKQFHEIRQMLDAMAIKMATKIGLPLFAFQSPRETVPDRKDVKTLEKSEAIFSLQGFVKGGFRNGIDELSSPENRRNVNGCLYYHNYNELYCPTEQDLKIVREQQTLQAETLTLLSTTQLKDYPKSLIMGYLFNSYSKKENEKQTDTNGLVSKHTRS